MAGVAFMEVAVTSVRSGRILSVTVSYQLCPGKKDLYPCQLPTEWCRNVLSLDSFAELRTVFSGVAEFLDD